MQTMMDHLRQVDPDVYEAIQREAKTLAKRLGHDGLPFYSANGGSSTWGYRRTLMLSFEAVEKLLAELGR